MDATIWGANLRSWTRAARVLCLRDLGPLGFQFFEPPARIETVRLLHGVPEISVDQAQESKDVRRRE
jgi:hypothetical protein